MTKCITCGHPDRARIETLLAGGASLRALGRKFGIDFRAIHAHWKRHVTDERKSQLIFGPVQREHLASLLSEESSSVIDHYRAIRAGLYTLYSAAVEAGDRNGGAILAARLTEVTNAIAKVTGQLATSPLVTHNTLNVYQSPELSQALDGLLLVIRAALEKEFPDALVAVQLAVRAALERDDEPEPAAAVEATPAPTGGLLIEHEREEHVEREEADPV